MKKLIIISAVAILLAAVPAFADVITFDDMTDGSSTHFLPVGYAGLDWDPDWFWWSFDQPPYTPSSPDTRIATHTFGGWIGFSSLGAVTFDGAYFSGRDDVSVYFEGYLGGSLVGTSATLGLSSTPTFLAANFGGPVDYVNMVSSSFNYFAMDDVTYSVIPAPGALLLGSMGMGIVGWLRRRRMV